MTQDARSKLDNAVGIGVMLSNSSRPKKLCPVCGQPGSGPYQRWVRNSRHKRYEPYSYFAHRQGPKKIRWCYLGKAKPHQRDDSELDNNQKEHNNKIRAQLNEQDGLKPGMPGYKELEP